MFAVREARPRHLENLQNSMQTKTTNVSLNPHPTPERIMHVTWSFASSSVLATAVELSVFTHIANGKTSLREIASATKASPRGLNPLLDALVGLGVLSREGSGAASGFKIAPDAEAFLVEGRSGYLGDFIRFHAQMAHEGWSHLTECVRTGTPFKSIDNPEKGPELWDKLVDSLFALSYPASRELGKEIVRTRPQGPIAVLDVAAGSGVWGIGAAETDPRVKVTAMDLEATLPHTRRFVEQRKLGSRFEFLAGDLRKTDFGQGKYDAAILGHICHSEGPTHTQALFAKLARALKPGGTLAIAEFLPDADRRGPLIPLLFSLTMLVNTTEGGTYTLSEFEGWLTKAGFRDCRTLAAPGPSPLILATR
jgi:ubiquinone/menaquinone biosynthesis C-methylase UbiE